MKIVFVSNYINHHQVGVSDELWVQTNGNYTFIEVSGMPNFRKSLGYADFSDRPYVLQAWKNNTLKEKSFDICREANVILFSPSDECLKYGVLAARLGILSFEVSERWLKKGIINLLSPRLLKNMWYYHTTFKYSKVYKLCSSAYATNDQYLLKSYFNKCYKWGYFTNVDDINITSILENRAKDTCKIMWCSRFLNWKHPELPIIMAECLIKKGYNFSLDMFGSGDQLDKIQKLVHEKGLESIVNFHGSLPNKEIILNMRRSDIFLFTSDKNEGWGAVANEAMSNGCVLIGSNAIGSIPFLVKDGENGCIFKACDIESLTEKVAWLIDNPIERQKIALNGYRTMRDNWSPENAAKKLLQLIDDILHGRESSISDGPCSKALPI